MSLNVVVEWTATYILFGAHSMLERLSCTHNIILLFNSKYGEHNKKLFFPFVPNFLVRFSMSFYVLLIDRL